MGLREGDLKHLVDDVFEIDSYASKMGDDKNIVTLSFSCRDKDPAEDLANFLEKGYSFILDADVPAGEQNDGTYKVFVEIERDNTVHDNIMELIDGVGKLSGRDKFKYRYYKDFRSRDATLENVTEDVPDDPENYGIVATESNMKNFKNFFNRSYVDSITMNENILTISKKYAEPLKFEFLGYGKKEKVLSQIKETINVNEFAEIIFLSKYIGDYNITKYGRKLTFENNGFTIVLKRL